MMRKAIVFVSLAGLVSVALAMMHSSGRSTAVAAPWQSGPETSVRELVHGRLHLEPPSGAAPALDAESAYQGVLKSHLFVPDVSPTRATLAFLTDYEFGKPITAPADNSKTVEERTQRARTESMPGGRAHPLVTPAYAGRLAWIFEFDHFDNEFSGVGPLDSIAYLVVDANSGEYLETLVQSVGPSRAAS
jgi:hypothetical protein